MKPKKSSQKRTRAARAEQGRGPEMPKRRLNVIQEAHALPRLSWNDPVFTPAWQNALALASANTTLEILQDSPDRARLVALGRKLMDSQSVLASGMIARGTAGTISCGDGCDACCHQIVGATPLELLVIADHLAAHEGTLDSLRERARILANAARTVGRQGRSSPAHPCVFLVNHRCSIYEVRPLICRGINALDRAICETLLNDARERETRRQRGEGSPGYVEPVHAAHALSAGLQIALFELYTLAMHPLDLTLAVDHILNVEPIALEIWLNGGDPFGAVRGGHDSDNPERLRSVGVNL
jgi:Fe-S-cluster containining protein